MARPRILDTNVLMGNVPTPIVTLKVGRRELVGVDSRRGIDGFKRHVGSLLVGSLMVPGMMGMLGMMGVVAGTITAKLMGMALIVVMVFIHMILLQANRIARTGHFVMVVNEMLTKMAFLGMGIQNHFMAFHVINMFAKDFTMRTVRKSLGRNNDSGFGQSGMARGLEAASANGLVILHRKDFRDRLHVYSSFGVAPGIGHFLPGIGLSL